MGARQSSIPETQHVHRFRIPKYTREKLESFLKKERIRRQLLCQARAVAHLRWFSHPFFPCKIYRLTDYSGSGRHSISPSKRRASSQRTRSATVARTESTMGCFPSSVGGGQYTQSIPTSECDREKLNLLLHGLFRGRYTLRLDQQGHEPKYVARTPRPLTMREIDRCRPATARRRYRNYSL